MKASINALCALALISTLTGCILAPVQERTLTNGKGGSITCKQTGDGLISGPLGKSRFDSCVQAANAQGYK